MTEMYVLDYDGNPVIEEDVRAWGKWFENADRVVRQDKVHGYFISTVFLGIDHQFGFGPPLLYETMVFGPNKISLGYQERYPNRHAALAGHDQAVAAVRSGEIGVGP